MTGRLVTVDGFPSRLHPESLERELPEADEEWLGELCAGLWPEDEYAAIVAEFVKRPGAE